MVDKIPPSPSLSRLLKTDKSDTHDYIRHHDPDFYKNNKKRKSHPQSHDHDEVDIAIETLIAFLNGMKNDHSTHNINDHRIDTLIQYLRDYMDHGYDHLYLVNGDDFFDSIQKTVEKINAMK